jgi:hypothetical protein
MLLDALQEMVLAYQQQGKEFPSATDLFEQVFVELAEREFDAQCRRLRLSPSESPTLCS